MGKRAAFTLVELILVITIITIIIAVVFLLIKPHQRIGDTMDSVRELDSQAFENSIQYAIADGLSLTSLDSMTVDTPYMLVKEGESTVGKITCDLLGGDIDKIDILTDIKNEMGNIPTDPVLAQTSTSTGYFIYKHGNDYIVESCHSYAKIDMFECGGIIRDSELNEYNTVVIGGQCWLARSLDLGTMLASAATMPANNGILEKWCYDNDSNLCSNEGALYQWDEAMRYSTTNGAQGICPNGWHIPTDEEIKTMEIALGMTQVQADTDNAWRGTDQGTKIKVNGSANFALTLSGSRDYNAAFAGRNSFGYFWGSTESSTNARRRVVSSLATIYRDVTTKNRGLPVRCVKN